MNQNIKVILRKAKEFWDFVWKDDSWESWLVSVILAYILIRFLLYPGLGFMFGTEFPIVAVVSGSMEHEGYFDDWWDEQKSTYNKYGISKEEFKKYPFHNGFDKGDIMLLKGVDNESLKRGDVLVFFAPSVKPEPIIHRIIKIKRRGDTVSYQTKGDHNEVSQAFEQNIPKENLVGSAFFRVPLLGHIKIAFVCGLDQLPWFDVMPDKSSFFECVG